MLRYLTLSLMSVLEMCLLPCNGVFLPMWWIDIHHLNLTFWMINGSLLVTLSSINDFLTTVWPFLPLFHVASINYLLLVSLKNLGRVSGDSTTTSLFEAKASGFGLWAEGNSILCLVNLVLHLICFVSAVNIHTCRTTDLVKCIVMLHVHCISTHGRFGLTL